MLRTVFWPGVMSYQRDALIAPFTSSASEGFVVPIPMFPFAAWKMPLHPTVVDYSLLQPTLLYRFLRADSGNCP